MMIDSDDELEISRLCNQVDELKDIIIDEDVSSVSKYIEENHITPDTYKLLPWYKQTDILYPVDVASDVGDTDVLELLLSLGFSPHGVNSNPIFAACKHGHVPIIKLLIKHGVDIHGSSLVVDPPHCCAIEYGQCEALMTLVEAGACVTSPSMSCQYTYPISHAASVGASDICLYLVSHGADVNCHDYKHRTPLYQAARHHRVKACQVLLDNGANINTKSCSGLTPFLAAVSTLHLPKFEITTDRLDVMKLLVSYGADTNAVDNFGCSALHYAAHSYKLTRYLVDRNVTLDIKDHKDATPLQRALTKGCYSVAMLLLEAGHRPVDVIDETKLPGKDIPPKLQEYMSQIMTQPRTLQDLCCFKIRNILKSKLCDVINNLPLPKTVMDFVMLKHIPASQNIV